MKRNVLTKIVTPVLIVLSVLFIKTNISYASTYNLIPNPSFEDGVYFPSSWSPVSGGFCNTPPTSYQSSVEWSTSKASTGSKSIGITNVYLPTPYTRTSVKISSDFIDINSTSQFYKLDGRNQGTPGNKGLRPELTVCFYDSNENVTGSESITTPYPPNSQTWYGFNIGGLKIRYFPPSTTKIKIGISANCDYQFLPPGASQDCSGSVWFDNITLTPIGDITTHVFEDLNENMIQDPEEQSLKQHRVSFYKGFDCQEPPGYFQNSPTDVNGNTIAKDQPFGDYSVKQDFTYHPGWKNTTPSCQNITIQNSNPPAIQIGATKAPSFPYFSQLDPVWATQEYDHASQVGPFFCGYTIGVCGCAITSAAMLLKFHGATKSPNGETTNPDSLNTWLKDNNGYAFGALKWNSIAAYSVKANKTFGTQKIKFMGTSPANDFATLDQDLSRNNPQILQEPGHFIVTNAKQTQTYSIKDPAYEQKKTLSEYSNSFLSSRRFEKTNTDLSAIYISTPTPNELFLTDSQGRRVGKDPEEGIVYLEIPNSFYFLEPALTDQSQENPITPQESVGVNTLVIINPQPGDFTMHSNLGPIDFSAYDREGEIKILEQSSKTTETFEIIYSPEPGASFRVIQKVEIDIKPRNHNQGDGVLPIAILSDTNFDAQTVDLQSIKIAPGYISPIRVPLFISRSADKLKDLLIFFEANGLSFNINQKLCLEGMTKDGEEFKGCNSP